MENHGLGPPMYWQRTPAFQHHAQSLLNKACQRDAIVLHDISRLSQ